MVELPQVRKFFLYSLGTVVAMVIIVAIALPFAVPPLVKTIAEHKLAEFGFPSQVSMRLAYGWNRGPNLSGNLQLSMNGSPWNLWADFGASFGEWHAEAHLPETEFSESEPMIASLLEKYPVKAVSNLVFSGKIALDASVKRTRKMPVPVWNARIPIKDVSADMTSNGKEVAIRGLSVTPSASGIADHVDFQPIFLRTKAIDAAGFTLSNLVASIRVAEKSLLVSEASADFCKGKVALYSVFIDPAKLNTGFTLFVDDVDAGEVLSHISGFNGTASGRLHGKIKLFIRNAGKAIRFSDAFLYSTPGETGKLQMTDPQPITDNLGLAGMSQGECDNVANALSDLDYSVLKLNLKRGEGQNVALTVHLEGTATRKGITVPVNLQITLNSKLEHLINTGLKLPDKLKGK